MAADNLSALIKVTTRLIKPTVGFEPTTTGLQNQSSTVELRWHNFRIYYLLIQPSIINHKSKGAALFYIECEIAARKLRVSCMILLSDSRMKQNESFDRIEAGHDSDGGKI
jgi:hypothetical protein